jgi:hypothetical protein
MDGPELQILISAIDEASATMGDVGDSAAAMGDEVSSSASAAADSFAEFGLQVNETTGEIEDALLTQEESFALAADLVNASSEEMIDVMMSEGISAQEAAAVVEEANAEIAASSEAASTASAGAYGGLAAIAGIAFFAIKSAISDAVSSAVEWDETSAQLVTILKDTGSAIPLSQLQAYAQQIQSMTLFSQQEALSSEALIVSHRNLQGSYQNLTVMAADLATKMGSDLPNATRMLTNALTDPVAGLNQLIRQGNIDFPAATVQLIENMAKVGNTAGADALIIKTLEESIGGVATAAAGAPGAALAQLSNQIVALGTAVGSDLLPLLDALAKDLGPVIQEITQWVQAHPKLTDAIVIGTAALVALALIVGVLGVAIITVEPVIEAIGVIIGVLSGPVGLLIIAIALLATQVVANWKTIKSDTEALVAFWRDAWTEMGTILSTIWQTIESTVKSGVNSVISAINAFINALDALHISIPSIALPGTKLSTPAINLGFNIPNIPMLAEGGLVTSPTLALIGEAGPEAVVPLSGAGFGAAGGVNIYIQGGYYLDQNAAKQIGDALAKQVVAQLRVRNYAS